MKIFNYIKFTVTICCVVLLSTLTVEAQHTVGASAGYTIGSFRPYPEIETGSVSGGTGGLSWRYYTNQRLVGCVGVDLEFIQRGFTVTQNTAAVADGDDPLLYTRNINSLMLPIVWQPHFYLANHRVRVFLEAAATFSYNLSSTYSNESVHEYWPNEEWKGDYEFKLSRDNRWGYGLMGGGGIAVLVNRFEIMARVRYYFGYSDIVRNLNKYRDNGTDGAENPFSTTPLRSPMDNQSISIGVNYRMGKGTGFDSWEARSEPKVKMGRKFTDTIITTKDKDQKSQKSQKSRKSQDNTNEEKQ